MLKVLRRAALSSVLLGFAVTSSADPLVVTGGFIHLEHSGLIPNPAFVLQGNSFDLRTDIWSSFVTRPDPWALACSSAASGAIQAYACRAGDIVDLSFNVSGDLGLGPATVDGRQYDALNYRGTLSVVAPPVVFRPADEEAFEVVGLLTTFVFQASLRAFDGDREVFSHSLIGRGIATMEYENEGARAGGRPLFTPMGDGESGPTYRFAPVPEPAALQLVTMALGGGGLSLALGCRRRRPRARW